MPAHPELLAHSEEFRKEIIELAPGVFTAVGYAASNVHLLVGADGVVVIDTTESTKAAENILAEFRKITDRPVATIVYTHSHRDHISGASVFAAGASPEIIASSAFSSDLVVSGEEKPSPRAALLARTARQFGVGLDHPAERINLGCGPGDRPMEGMGAGYLPPTMLLAEPRTRLERCGFTMELLPAHGETPDHLIVWLPDQRVLFCGDNYYKSFPNLYAIRGTRYRDFDLWAEAVELLLAFDAEVLSAGHSRPLRGAATIRAVLTDYRDAIRHVVAETAAGMNAGLTPDELAHTVRLPAHLGEKPYLREFYGKVAWAVRAYFAGTLGWFDGNPTNLARLAPGEEARRLIALAGGAERLQTTAEAAHRDGDHQWALELCDRLLAADQQAAPARALKTAALRAMADREINATARNYYLVSARELERDTTAS